MASADDFHLLHYVIEPELAHRRRVSANRRSRRRLKRYLRGDAPRQ